MHRPAHSFDWVLLLLRQIIALANLRNKATHSAQTVLSHFRRDGDSQTWLPKEAAVQTQVRRAYCFRNGSDTACIAYNVKCIGAGGHM